MFSRVLMTSLIVSATVFAGEPTLRNVNIRGLQIGGKTTIVLDGDDLGKAPKLLLPFAVKETLGPKSTPSQANFEVELPDTVPPGYYHLRVQTEEGVSLPIVVGVDRLSQKIFAAKIETLPVTLHGTIAGSNTLETTFQGKKGQKIQVEIEAQRLGSKLRPVLHLLGPRKLQTAWSWPVPHLLGDTRLEATLPEDGAYTITLHDAEYAAAAPSFFRLRVGTWDAIDQVFPPVVSQSASANIELMGTGPSAKSTIKTSRDPYAILDWPKGGNWSGPRPFVTVSPHQEIVGAPVTGKVQPLPNIPIGVSGKLSQARAEDRYSLAVKPGSKLRFEVFAERIGSPIDVSLVLRGEKGNDLLRGDDRPGTLDPQLDFTAPANMTTLEVAVVDAQGQGGPRGIYRLVVTSGAKAVGASDFELSTNLQRLTILQNGSTVLPVRIDRKGYSGPVELQAVGLGKGYKLENLTIPAGADGALVTIRREGKGEAAVISQWRGKTSDGSSEPIVLRNHPLEKLQPWLATEIALAPSSKPASDLQIDWRDLPKDAAFVPASKLSLPVKVNRADPKQTVRLTFLSTQIPPLVNNQPDANAALKLDKVIELPAKTDDGTLDVTVPAGVFGPSFDVTVQAELLAPDKKTVSAVAYAPVRRLEVKEPISIALTGPPNLEATLDPKTGASFKIAGKITRREGLTSDVTVSLAGLPAGLKADAATVKAKDSDFAVTVALPSSIGLGEIGGLKLSASAPLDAKTPNVKVRSRDYEITLVVK